MIRKSVVLFVAALLLNLSLFSPAMAGTRTEKDARLAEKVRAGIAKLGTGPNAQLEVKLHDKTKLKGYVSQADETQFVVVEPKTGVATTVLYPQVRTVRGNNLSNGTKFAIGVGIAVLAVVVFCVVHGCEE